MGFPPSPTPNTHLYPQELQLKLYQAFIFSIPILFSIILFLLFYLFYLKRRTTSLSSPSQILPAISSQSTPHLTSSVCEIGLKKEIKDRLPIALFDEELRTRESQCCVCLGEFQMKEELLQMPSCKHVFHIECIHIWLHTSTTCPLCRSFVIPITKFANPSGQSDAPEQQQQHQDLGHTHANDQILITFQESQTHACPDFSISMENNGRATSSAQESVVLQTSIQ